MCENRFLTYWRNGNDYSFMSRDSIADSSSKNAVSFSSASATKRFPSPLAGQEVCGRVAVWIQILACVTVILGIDGLRREYRWNLLNICVIYLNPSA